MIFVGVDWAEAHQTSVSWVRKVQVLGKPRVAEGVSGLADLHRLVADHAEEPDKWSSGSRPTGGYSSRR